MSKFIQPATGIFLALTVPVFAVMGFHVLAKQEIAPATSPYHDVKMAKADHVSGGCCCAYCMQIAQ